MIACYLSPNRDELGQLRIDGADTDSNFATLTLTTAFAVGQAVTASLNCVTFDGGTDQSYVFVYSIRISAVAVDNISSQ